MLIAYSVTAGSNAGEIEELVSLMTNFLIVGWTLTIIVYVTLSVLPGLVTVIVSVFLPIVKSLAYVLPVPIDVLEVSVLLSTVKGVSPLIEAVTTASLTAGISYITNIQPLFEPCINSVSCISKVYSYLSCLNATPLNREILSLEWP